MPPPARVPTAIVSIASIAMVSIVSIAIVSIVSVAILSIVSACVTTSAIVSIALPWHYLLRRYLLAAILTMGLECLRHDLARGSDPPEDERDRVARLLAARAGRPPCPHQLAVLGAGEQLLDTLLLCRH